MSEKATMATTPNSICEYLQNDSIRPLFIHADALNALSTIPSESIDCCVTSPPYWGQRQYASEGVGSETDYRKYVAHLADIFFEVKRVLKKSGSFWLNLGDTYLNKRLLGIPWRVAFALTDKQDWILRNDVIWHKVKGGPDNSLDKLRNVHEYVFHFVKTANAYYYNADAIRSNPKNSKVVNGAVVSATGVRGVRYKRQIELSTALSEAERCTAYEALDEILSQVRQGKISDFRMIIRGQQRTTHSDSQSVSGRARELHEKGFYFLKYHPNGSKPRDVWDILPEDTHKRRTHFAAYPEDLCKIPIAATCPDGGVVLDPFCGTGTTMLVALKFGKKSIGIDVSNDYLKIAQERICVICG
ncbi:MAG TPA: site-specific DNA-methyltransferase [Pyrinomonadaceae bacterium]|nr:site-specific DNA-methyltransferase [Pyrinomonadaceae bacterium]